MNKSTMLMGTLALVAVVGAAALAFRMGEEQGRRQGPAADAGHVHPATPPSAATAAAGTAPDDPSAWTVKQGEAATRRHLKDGLKAGDLDPATGRQILYYHDPMAPGQRFDAPGKSPYMEMMLVPVYGGAASSDAGTVSVSARMRQNLGLRTASVQPGSVAPAVTAVGTIAWNERDQAVVQARATGYIERMHVRATLDRVARGAPIAELYVPDWVAAQEEFLALRRRGPDAAALADAARARMRQAGMSEAQIHAVEDTGTLQARITLVAPIGGVVTELAAREGMTVAAGTTLLRINGLGSVWAVAEVPESQAAALVPGVRVRATTPALPGATFDGRLQALLPEVNAQTRTLKARMELANPGGRLVPGMFVQMAFAAPPADNVLVVPTEAVIRTGKRAVVMLAEGDGRFRSVEVETGREADGRTEIRRGLVDGQRVVLSGQFLIDSEASLRGLETRLQAGDAAPGAKP